MVTWAIAGTWFAVLLWNVNAWMMPKSQNICTLHLRQLIVESKRTPGICWAISFDSEHFLIQEWVGNDLNLPSGILMTEGQRLC